eukprot:scaffold21256_cov40-Cyclotella_meneghiniana.AAC.3
MKFSPALTTVITSIFSVDALHNKQQRHLQTPTCSCAPRVFSFTLALDRDCSVNTIEANVGIAVTNCDIDDVSSPIPTVITSIQLFEFNSVEAVINIDNTHSDLDAVSGNTFAYVSKASDLDPSIPLTAQLDNVPKTAVLFMVGYNDNGDEIRGRFNWEYTNGCGKDEFTIMGGEDYGWISFDQVDGAMPEFCPALNDETDAPTNSPMSPPTSPFVSVAPTTMNPTNSPSSSPSTSPTSSPSASPSATPMNPTNSPSGSPSTSPTSSPSASPSATPTMNPTNSPSSSPVTCSCAPQVFSFTLALDRDCSVNTIEGNVGIADTNCAIDDVLPPIPTVITSIQWIELNTVGEVINFDFTQSDLDAVSGNTFAYVSKASDLDPSIPLSAQLDNVPKTGALYMVGYNDNGDEIQGRFFWEYTNGCGKDEFTIMGGEDYGWISFDQVDGAMPEFCPALNDETDAPGYSPAPTTPSPFVSVAPTTMNPTNSPSRSPSTSPTSSPSASPSATPTTMNPTNSPSGSPTNRPTGPATDSPSTPCCDDPSPSDDGIETPTPTIIVIETRAPVMSVTPQPTESPTYYPSYSPIFDIEDPSQPTDAPTAAPVTPRPTPIAAKSSKSTKNAKAKSVKRG